MFVWSSQFTFFKRINSHYESARGLNLKKFSWYNWYLRIKHRIDLSFQGSEVLSSLLFQSKEQKFRFMYCEFYTLILYFKEPFVISTRNFYSGSHLGGLRVCGMLCAYFSILLTAGAALWWYDTVLASFCVVLFISSLLYSTFVRVQNTIK